MIIDRIDNIRFYSALLPNLEAGLAAIEAQGTEEVGRFAFDGGFFMVQEGVTKPMDEGTYEAHKKYIDVQMVISGSEELAWSELDRLTVAIPYNPEKDQERYDGPKDHIMSITEGMFYAAFPQDGHKAISHTKEQQSYRKVVLKLPVAE